MTISDLRNQTITQLGFTDWLNNPLAYVDLTAQQQIDVTNGMMKFISQNPSQFTDAQVTQANTYLGTGIQNVPLADTSFSSDVLTFGSAVADQAVSLNNAINPFSEQNRKWVLLVVVLGVGLWVLGPRLIESIGNKTLPPSP